MDLQHRTKPAELCMSEDFPYFPSQIFAVHFLQRGALHSTPLRAEIGSAKLLTALDAPRHRCRPEVGALELLRQT